MFTGVIVDTMTIILGGASGLLIKKGISKKMENVIMNGLALSAIYIGVTSMMSGEKTIFIILSIVIGGIIGEWMDLDGLVNRLAKFLAIKIAGTKKDDSFSEGFITGSLIMSVGALSIMGPINSGLTGDHTLLYTNAMMDGITSMILASTLGIGVLFSSLLVFSYEALIVIFANGLNHLLSTSLVNDMNAIGSILVLVIGLNMLHLTDIKVMNFVPALFVPIVFFLLY